MNPLKSRIKKYLKGKGWYYRVKYSLLFRAYESIFKPAVSRQRKTEVDFYRSFLAPCQLIFDIGANDGHKTEAFLKLAQTVVCCEPDGENARLLTDRFRNKRSRVILVNKAVSDIEGTTIMHLHRPGSAFNTLSPKWAQLLENDGEKRWQEKISFKDQKPVATTTLDALIEQYGVPQFIKIDTEGSEEAVLNGLSHPIPVISFETLLPEYATELTNCLQRIETISKAATYNLALDEKLVLPAFVAMQELLEWLHTNPQSRGFEVIAKCR